VSLVHHRMLSKAAIAAGAGLLASLGLASAAHATTTCTFAPNSHAIGIGMSQNGDDTRLSVGTGGAIVVRDSTTATVACSGGSPTVINTDIINVTDNSGASTLVRIDRPNAFAPGFTSEGPGEPSEIEIHLNLGSGPDDFVFFNGDQSHRVNIRLGAAGVNTNAADLGTSHPDVDVDGNGIETYKVTGSTKGDTVIAQGATPFDSPATVLLRALGYAGNDVLGGGEVTPDKLNGGADNDTVTYAHVTTAVAGKVNGTIYQNNTGTGIDTLSNVENLVGSPYTDTLTGDAHANVFRGGPGADVLKGAGERDRLYGGRGSDLLRGQLGIDTLFARDHNKDSEINCGGGANSDESATADPQDPAPLSC
jgi:Ca2+-binding RTX toxin-like protein